MVSALYQGVLGALQLAPGSHLLDAGCGAGLFCVMAAATAQKICGLDASAAMLDIARRRLPLAQFLQGELEQLPFLDASFDAVTGLNSFQFANRPLNALKEAHRVLKPGGRLVLATWGRPESCEATACLRALDGLVPPAPGTPGPFSLSPDGAIGALTTLAGFHPLAELQATTVWDYPDEATARRGLLSMGPATRVISEVGETAAWNAVRASLAPFRQAEGNIRLRNTFRYALVRK